MSSSARWISQRAEFIAHPSCTLAPMNATLTSHKCNGGILVADTPTGADTVLYEQRGPVAVLTFNRPDRLNAWTGELGRRYFDLLDRCVADQGVGAIVVTGAGKGWCAGADMDMLQGIGSGSASGESRDPRPNTYVTSIPKPVIAAINGACAGLGFVHAMMTDVRFAASGAKFTTSFARRGLVAEHGVSWVLPRLIGPGRALDLLMSGRVILAEEAAEMGIVNQVVAPEELLDTAVDYATQLATLSSPTSMAVMKQQVWGHLQLGLSEALEESNELMKASLRRDDFREGVRSFVEGREPTFDPYSS
jgi:enoyl-CoA hydratase/carnithine racemase